MKRTLDLAALLRKSSHFLFGARGVGKSYLIRHSLLEEVDYIDLLHSETFIDLQANPSRLEGMVSKKWVVVDEVQRLPELLNEVHRLIEAKGITFLLTSSSARKFKKGRANLLAGRAFISHLHPMTWKELEENGNFSLEKYLKSGGLPQAVLQNDTEEYLYAYVNTYLKEEIQMESLVRNLANYHRFLNAAASTNGELLNFSKIANDAQLKPNTVRDYYQILQDTLIGGPLLPWNKSIKRKAIQTSKFYFFDIGVVHTIQNIKGLDVKSNLYGKAFEHFIYMEIKACLSYHNIRDAFFYWRAKNGQEVDFIIGDEMAIEVKAKEKVTNRDAKGLRAISEEKIPWKHKLIVSRDRQRETFAQNICKIHWQEFLQNLWSGVYF